MISGIPSRRSDRSRWSYDSPSDSRYSKHEALGAADRLLANASGRVHRELFQNPPEGHAARGRPAIRKRRYLDGGQIPWLRQDVADGALLHRHGRALSRQPDRRRFRHGRAGYAHRQKDSGLLYSQPGDHAGDPVRRASPGTAEPQQGRLHSEKRQQDRELFRGHHARQSCQDHGDRRKSGGQGGRPGRSHRPRAQHQARYLSSARHRGLSQQDDLHHVRVSEEQLLLRHVRKRAAGFRQGQHGQLCLRAGLSQRGACGHYRHGVLPKGTAQNARSEIRDGIRQHLRGRGIGQHVPLRFDGGLPDAPSGGIRAAFGKLVRLCHRRRSGNLDRSQGGQRRAHLCRTPFL